MNSIGEKDHEEKLARRYYLMKNFHWKNSNSSCIKMTMIMAFVLMKCLNMKAMDLNSQSDYKKEFKEVKILLYKRFYLSIGNSIYVKM